MLSVMNIKQILHEWNISNKVRQINIFYSIAFYVLNHFIKYQWFSNKTYSFQTYTRNIALLKLKIIFFLWASSSLNKFCFQEKERFMEVFESVIDHCFNAFNLQSIVFLYLVVKKNNEQKLLINQYKIFDTNTFVLNGKNNKI